MEGMGGERLAKRADDQNMDGEKEAKKTEIAMGRLRE